ncbi:glycosyltransferase family protein [Pedobacter kyonggii]|uniref:Glycosyltransferase subfamily 4-like N-terminal domain-containing protein n=1 Tax=Pedobacter kyonggii TaxID=1926871 RepID=A0A4Q9HCP7_9SPHI|nr:glycosyltransferase [Pedobacter kyonggii]TBO42199.1 hypothetical protein EYS08_11775 [Pedobacter kyonggii]
MKKLLIISPYFPPSNAADMQRIRMSLPYFKEYDWKVEVVTVAPVYSDFVKDDQLKESVPTAIKIHEVKAFSKKWTSKIGLGSIALRSLWFYKVYVDKLLKKQHFDLIYFSTTQFPVLILGAHWKKKFNVPYVIDMQDPWHSTYYEDKSKTERPAKYWFSYRLNKYLEPIAMNKVGGLISVSQAYLDTLVGRYPRLKEIPKQVITFGAFKPDFEWAKNKVKERYPKEEGTFNFIYVGRGGHDMKAALILLFRAFKKGLTHQPEQFNKIRFHFIGTSYAPQGQGIPTIKPLASEMGIAEYMEEQTDRISFYDSIYTLLTADALMIIGSDDPQYTASKIYPYILAERPLLAFFHPESSAAQIIENCNAGTVISLIESKDLTIEKVYDYLLNASTYKLLPPEINWKSFDVYSAENMCKNQCELFTKVIQASN